MNSAAFFRDRVINTRSTKVQARDFVLANQKIRVIGMPDLLAGSTEALAHLPSFTGLPDLTIDLRTELPQLEDISSDGVLHLDKYNQDMLQFLSGDFALCQTNYPLLTYQQCAPFVQILRAWLETKAITVLHAAAVATTQAATLLIGRGGSGKSTTSLLALKAGLGFLGDDYCAVSLTPNPMVHSLYSSAKFHFDNTARLSFLKPRKNPDFEKAFVMLSETHAPQLILQAPIKAVLLPTLGGQLGFEAVHPQTALLALAPNSLFQLRSSQIGFAQMSQLLRTVPCYRLYLGDMPAAVTPAIAAFLDQP
jgi:hypothetical protein